MKNNLSKVFLLAFIAALCIFTSCTSSVPQTEEDNLKLKIQEFVDYLVKLDYSNAQACLITDGPTYSQLDALHNKVRLITVSGGFSNCFTKIYFNCISSSDRVTFEDLNLTAAQKIGDDWFLW